MVSQGPKNGNIFANDDTVGTIPWNSPNNARRSDNDYAYLAISPNLKSNYLKATDFGFRIPNGAIINGIRVDVEKMAEYHYWGGLQDNSVKIVKGGTIQGDDKALTDYWETSDTYVAYGSSTDLWGVAWTAEDINASNFGFVVSAKNVSAEEYYSEVRIDHIRITIYYEFGLTSCSTLPFGAFPGIPQRRPFTV